MSGALNLTPPNTLEHRKDLYPAIDLHSNNSYLAIIDGDDNVTRLPFTGIPLDQAVRSGWAGENASDLRYLHSLQKNEDLTPSPRALFHLSPLH
jgi:hypothetical protein